LLLSLITALTTELDLGTIVAILALLKTGISALESPIYSNSTNLLLNSSAFALPFKLI
jgi:hypothetical protein